MYVNITYDTKEKNGVKHYDNIRFDFDYYSDDIIVEKVTQIISGDSSNSEKVEQFKQLLGCTDNIQECYDFKDDTCTIYYKDDKPPEKLYIEIEEIYKDSDGNTSYFSSDLSDEFYIPRKIHITKPSNRNTVLEYTFGERDGWQQQDRYVWTNTFG